MIVHQNKNNYQTYAIKIIAGCAAFLISLQPGVVAAGNYDAQIDATQREVATYQEEQTRLQNYAASLEQELAQLSTQLSDVKALIAQNESKYNALENDVLIQEKDVKKKSDELGAVLRQSYIANSISPLEMLASPRGLSYYMDFFEAQDTIQSKLTQKLKNLKAAKKQLVARQQKVLVVLRDGKAMRDTLEKKQKDQQSLLDKTRGQQERYAQLTSERNANIAQFRADQLAANRTYFSTGQVIAGDPNKGGYPAIWDGADQDTLVDDWGMYNRECVSYTAWKVHQSGRRMPFWGGRGNANQWPSSAQSDGIATGNTPRVGAVAIAYIGPFGHAMYVEEVRDDGKIRVSEYNYNVDGRYSERIVSASNLTYVYF